MKPIFVRPTKIWEFFRGQGLRVTGEAKEKILENLEVLVGKYLHGLTQRLPKYSSGTHKGRYVRVTLKLEDVDE